MDDDLELDFIRFMYDRVDTLGGDTYWVKVGCYHRNREPVLNSLTGEPVAELCLDCDNQLPVMRGD